MDHQIEKSVKNTIDYIKKVLDIKSKTTIEIDKFKQLRDEYIKLEDKSLENIKKFISNLEGIQKKFFSNNLELINYLSVNDEKMFNIFNMTTIDDRIGYLETIKHQMNEFDNLSYKYIELDHMNKKMNNSYEEKIKKLEKENQVLKNLNQELDSNYKDIHDKYKCIRICNLELIGDITQSKKFVKIFKKLTKLTNHKSNHK